MLATHQLEALNDAFDRFPDIAAGDWIGNSLMHGAASRTNLGERRVVILRYAPSWARTRFGYEYSPEFLGRLTPARRHIMNPVPRVVPGEARIPKEARHNIEA